MKNFKTKKEAIKYCIDMIKPSNLDDNEEYNSLRLIRNRYNKDPESIKENAIQRLFDRFGIKQECKYYIDEKK